jgi:proton-translocating NADH-quinone oxidoreductase chain L
MNMGVSLLPIFLYKLHIYLLPIVLFMPLLNFFSLSLFGDKIGKYGATLLSTFFIFLTMLLSIISFTQHVVTGACFYFKGFSWISCGVLNVEFGLIFDSISTTMFVTINIISWVVHVYSCSYMQFDKAIVKFLSYISLFTFFMLILVSADNFLQLFLGWEGVGLCSYLLVNFWYTRVQANKSAVKALITNRVGDFFLLLGIIMIFDLFKTLNFAVIFTLLPFYIDNFLLTNCVSLTTITLLLFFGAVGKSAQVGLHIWLPDAMEGPTPVSALIHAATMVTAGVFLVIRCSWLFEYTPKVLVVLIFFGSFTTLFGSSIALVQTDMKKIIAYSTCSQLGYMILACGISNYNGALFHLVNHAFFKALLFLCAGSIIHSLAGEQDSRKMGFQPSLCKHQYVFMHIGSIALIALPPYSGFWSKDSILDSCSSHGYTQPLILMGYVSATFTLIYSTKLFYGAFLNYGSYSQLTRTNTKFLGKIPFIMRFCLYLLSILSLFSGYILSDIFLGISNNFFNQTIFLCGDTLSPVCHIMHIFILFNFWSNLYVVHKFSYTNFNLHNFKNIKRLMFSKLLYNKHYFDLWFSSSIGFFLFTLSYKLLWSLDKGILELFGPYGIINALFTLFYKLNAFLGRSFQEHFCLIIIVLSGYSFPIYIYIWF